MYTQILKHLTGEERKGEAQEGPKNRIGREHRRRIYEVAVDEVIDQAEKQQEQAEPERDRGHDGHDPVNAGVVCPGEPKEAYRQRDRGHQGRR